MANLPHHDPFGSDLDRVGPFAKLRYNGWGSNQKGSLARVRWSRRGAQACCNNGVACSSRHYRQSCVATELAIPLVAMLAVSFPP